jgi:hypothetical protein
MSLDTLEQIVMDLHYAARKIELELGHCALSDDIRKCANRLSIIVNPPIPQKHTEKGE